MKAGKERVKAGTHADADLIMLLLLLLLPHSPLEGKPLVDRDAVKAGKEEVEAGTHPNADLIKQFEKAAKDAFDSGEPAYKGAAWRKVSDVSVLGIRI